MCPGDFKFLSVSGSCRFISSFCTITCMIEPASEMLESEENEFKPYLLYLPKAAFLFAKLKISSEHCAALFK